MKKIFLNLLCIGAILLMQSPIPASSVLEKTTPPNPDNSVVF